MKSTGSKLILVSFILALIASAAVFIYFQSLRSPKEITKKITVLVAVDTIPARTLIDKKMLKEIQVQDNTIFDGYLKDESEIVGKYNKETILKNEGVQADNLLDKNGNELSLKIGSNCRAISISVTGDSGVSDLLEPGDFVDVIAYIAEKKDGANIVTPDMAKLILQNMEILAVDKQLIREDNGDNNNSSNNSSNINNDKTQSNFLVTLSVPTADLEKLVLSESIGTIKLALRPLKDGSTTETTGTTLEELTVNTNGDNGATYGQGDNSNNISSGKGKYTTYTIKQGDTLKKISCEFYGDESKYYLIKEANGIEDEDLIFVGEIIQIPILQK